MSFKFYPDRIRNRETADDIEPGSWVYIADTVQELREMAENNAPWQLLYSVLPAHRSRRFCDIDRVSGRLAYLIRRRNVCRENRQACG